MLKVDSLDKYYSDKIVSFENAVSLIEKLKKEGNKVGLCHGGFDFLHPGHVTHFNSAKKLCDVLIVSVTSDKFVTSRKGTGRPVFTDKLRAFMIANLDAVDYAVISDFKLGVDVINKLKPSFYIKGPDFINKQTPGITAEREAIKSVGGEMKYTNDPKLGTTELIDYIKNELDVKQILVGIDRDGTLIEDADYIGKNKDWKKEVKIKKAVLDAIIFLQTKYNTTNIVITNQAGVARRYFSCKDVEEINSYVDSLLKEKRIRIDNWQYCPDVDKKYAELKKDEVDFDPRFVKEKTKRKPSTDMLFDGLKELNKKIDDFAAVIIIGDKGGDKGDDGLLAKELGAIYLDANKDDYEELIKDVKDL